MSPKKKQDKPITKEELGWMLHKYINPIYEKIDAVQKHLEQKIDKLEGIQLRMENKLVDDNKLLHDRDDAHNKTLKDHEKRISSLEERP